MVWCALVGEACKTHTFFHFSSVSLILDGQLFQVMPLACQLRAMASGVERFELLLVNQRKVAPDVFAALKHLGCEGVADFVGLYTEADFEVGLKEVLQHTSTSKPDRIQLARLRVAWDRAKQDLSTTSAGSHLRQRWLSIPARLSASS